VIASVNVDPAAGSRQPCRNIMVKVDAKIMTNPRLWDRLLRHPRLEVGLLWLRTLR
jgi:hypothetical protein